MVTIDKNPELKIRNCQCKKDCQVQEKWISNCSCGYIYNQWLLENHSLGHYSSNCKIRTAWTTENNNN